MHLRILKLLDTHVYHDEVACTLKVNVMVKGQNKYCLIGLHIGRSVGSHILSVLFLTNHLVEFNKIVHEATIPRRDVHTLKVLQLLVILQSYVPFTSVCLYVSLT